MADEVTDTIDLDAVRSAHIEANPLTYRTLTLYGRKWQIRKEPNTATLLRFSDGGGVKGQVSFMLGYVHAEERDAFWEALEADEHLDEVLLEKIVDVLMGNGAAAPGGTPSTSDAPSSNSGTNSTEASLPEPVLSPILG